MIVIGVFTGLRRTHALEAAFPRKKQETPGFDAEQEICIGARENLALTDIVFRKNVILQLSCNSLEPARLRMCR